MQKKKGSKIMPKVFKRVLLLLTVASLLLISLCACAGDTTPGSENSASADSGELSKGSSVTVGIAQDLDSLDPHRAVNAGTSEVMFNIFEGLMKASPDGGVIPAVASDYEISPDGKTYTFTLRDGVKFHNGKTVTADDVVYSIERCAGIGGGDLLVEAFSVIRSVEKKDEKTGKLISNGEVHPIRGAWLEFEQDAQNVLWVHVDRTRKLTATVLLRAFYLLTR